MSSRAARTARPTRSAGHHPPAAKPSVTSDAAAHSIRARRITKTIPSGAARTASDTAPAVAAGEAVRSPASSRSADSPGTPCRGGAALARTAGLGSTVARAAAARSVHSAQPCAFDAREASTAPKRRACIAYLYREGGARRHGIGGLAVRTAAAATTATGATPTTTAPGFNRHAGRACGHGTGACRVFTIHAVGGGAAQAAPARLQAASRARGCRGESGERCMQFFRGGLKGDICKPL